jgi:hypothetical protein
LSAYRPANSAIGSEPVPVDGQKVPLSCWFGGVAIAQRLRDFNN